MWIRIDRNDEIHWDQLRPGRYTHTISCGQSFLATNSAIPDRQPNFLASYDAVVRTPPPTPNVFPFRLGSRLTSTAAYYH
jgi:hypothetical protein